MNNENMSNDVISNIMKMFNNKTNSSTQDSSTPQIDIETIMKMKKIVEQMNKKDDPRVNLLLSLKPYLKETRQTKVEQYIQLFKLSSVIDIFPKTSGGESIK